MTVFLSDQFYDDAKEWFSLSENGEYTDTISKNKVATIKRKRWGLRHGKIVTNGGKLVIPKRDIFRTLSEAHSAIAHRGRGKTEKYIRELYSEIAQEVIKLFVSLCKSH